ncbi:MAG: hypothetical protein HZB51_23755 [Chloroflexi bacterium]|nr:hypothetical protein [Chloroflexota bacterium]
MNFQEAEKAYKDLKAQHDAGKLNDAQFEAEVGKLRMQDEQGRWWQIGVQTGEWYMHDGQKWNKAKPPTASPPAAMVTPAPAPAPVPEPAKTTPPPKATANKKEEPPKADNKQPRASTMPRLFSAKPAGREGGLSRPMLIGIIAAVAVVILLLIVGGFFVFNNVLGTASAKPTSTATRALAVVPTSVSPSRAPTVAPTNTLAPPPTAVVTATATVTTTAPTRAPSGPTATRRPAGSPTPTVVRGSPTPNVPPGVYAMKLETDPAKLSTDPSQLVAFKLTMFNNTGSMQTFKGWFVRVFQCPEQCSDFKNSYGESLKADVNVATGSSVIVTAPHVHFGPGRCDYIAVPYYTDVNNQVIQFQTTKGGGLYYNFSICN